MTLQIRRIRAMTVADLVDVLPDGTERSLLDAAPEETARSLYEAWEGKPWTADCVLRCACTATTPGTWTAGVHHGKNRCGLVISRVP